MNSIGRANRFGDGIRLEAGRACFTGLEGSTPAPSAAIQFYLETTIDCRVGVHAYGAGCRGFESHRRDSDAHHCAVAQWESAVNPLTHTFVDRFFVQHLTADLEYMDDNRKV